MKKIICFFLFFVSFSSVFSQSLLTFKHNVYDYSTKQSVPYATIHLSNSYKYMDADENGFFEVSAKSSDTLFISCIGYKNYKNLFSNIKSDSIFLISIPLIMDTITLSKPKKITYGLFNDKISSSSISTSVEARQEFATLIEIPNSIKLFRISKILIKGKNFKDENPVRLHIYNVGSDGLPDKELLVKERIITKNDNDGKTVTIDIRDQGIILENASFFIGIQWLTTNKLKLYTGPEIFETFKTKKLLTFRRQLNIKNNKWFGIFQKNMIFYPEGITPSDDTPRNIMASAEIEVL